MQFALAGSLGVILVTVTLRLRFRFQSDSHIDKWLVLYKLRRAAFPLSK